MNAQDGELRFRSRTCFKKDSARGRESGRGKACPKGTPYCAAGDHHRRSHSSDPCVRFTFPQNQIVPSRSPVSQTHSFLVTCEGQHGAFGTVLKVAFGVFDLNFIQVVEWYELTGIFKPKPV